jgi:hypothetical protein
MKTTCWFVLPPPLLVDVTLTLVFKPGNIHPRFWQWWSKGIPTPTHNTHWHAAN